MSIKHFSNLKVDDGNENLMTFELTGVHLSLSNALRRILLADIPTIAIDYDSIVIHKNTSILDDVMVKRRLALLVFDYKVVRGAIDDEKKLEFKITNDTDASIDITTQQFEIKTKNDTLLLKLRPKGEFHFSAGFKISTQTSSGASFSAVCPPGVHFKRDEKMIVDEIKKRGLKTEEEKNRFMIAEADRFWSKNPVWDDIMNPKTFVWNLESIGHHPVKSLIPTAFDILITRIKTLHDSDLESIVKKYKNNKNRVDFIIQNENNTLGNLITKYLNSLKEIKFAGYIIPHPLIKSLVIRIETDSDKNKPIPTFKNALTNLNSYISKVKKSWP